MCKSAPRGECLRLTVAAVLLLFGSASLLDAAISGAIYTSNSNGAIVNQNLYDNKPDVYVNGGPQNLNASGLPDGTYYFQVTNPSGDILLSEDNAACRQLVVVGGVVAGATGPCPHANGLFNPANGSTPVQLVPFNDTPNPGGEYKAWLIAQTAGTFIDGNDPTVLHFNFRDSKTDNFKVRSDGGGPPQGLNFTISGTKFYDANANGLNDDGMGVPGVRIDVCQFLDNQLACVLATTTGATGAWSLEFGDGASYLVCEEVPLTSPGFTWMQTSPGTNLSLGGARCYSGTINGANVTGLDFGNACLGPGGGLTLGFWSNKNGQTILSNHDPAWRNLLTGLHLRNADGTNYDVPPSPANSFSTAYTSFRNWILGATATNMSYMLSAQLAAMECNANYGSVNGLSLVFAGPSSCISSANGLNSLGFLTVNNLMTAADTELGADGLTVAGNPDRACQEYKKNALDAANNNRTFVQPTPCPVVYP